jgi:hypothetical protein
MNSALHVVMGHGQIGSLAIIRETAAWARATYGAARCAA